MGSCVDVPRFSGHLACGACGPWERRSVPAPYPLEFRRRAVELVREGLKPVSQIARDIGVSESCLRNWFRQAGIDEGKKDGMSTSEKEELAGLGKECRVLRMERDLLSRAAALVRLGECPAEVIYRFMDANKADFPIRLMASRLGVRP